MNHVRSHKPYRKQRMPGGQWTSTLQRGTSRALISVIAEAQVDLIVCGLFEFNDCFALQPGIISKEKNHSGGDRKEQRMTIME